MSGSIGHTTREVQKIPGVDLIIVINQINHKNRFMGQGSKRKGSKISEKH